MTKITIEYETMRFRGIMFDDLDSVLDTLSKRGLSAKVEIKFE